MFDRLNDFSVDGEIKSSVQGTLMGTFDEMPTPSEKFKGKTVQYVGPNSLGGYVKGAFYKCEENTPGVFTWETINTPGGGSSTVTWTQNKNGLKIASIGINGASTDVEIPYASASEDGIVTIAQKAYIDTIPAMTAEIAAEVARAIGAEGNLYNAIVLKQDALNASQLAVLGSGITSGKVSAYDAHVASNGNPHNVSKAQVGLSNCDNTSDADKPVSTLQQAAIDAKQSKNLGGTAKADLIVTTDGSGNIGTDGSIQKGKLQLIKNLTSDAQAQLDNKVDKISGYSLSKIDLNGTVTSAPKFYAPTVAGTAETYLYWDTVTNTIGYKNLPGFIHVRGNKTGDELNAMTGSAVGDLYVCTADSTTAPQKYHDTAYYWTSDNEWAIFCQTTIDLSSYLNKQTTVANSVMVSDASKNIIPSGIGVSKLNFLSGVTSNIQDQLDGKQATLTGSYLTAVQSGINSTKIGNYDAHVANADIHVTLSDKTAWNAKQELLVSGTNIKTVGGVSILGSGDIPVSGSASFTTITGDPRDNTQLAAYLDAKQNSLTVDQLAAVNSGITASGVAASTAHIANADIHVTATEKNAWNAKQNALSTDQLAACDSGITATKVSTIETHIGDTTVHISSADRVKWDAKQNALVSGTNIKTVGGINIVGSGNADIIASDWTSTTLPQSASAILDKIKEYGADFKGTVPLVTDLAIITGQNINDWAIVTTDAAHENLTSRYSWNGSAWVWQYSINNMTFTTDQLAALNSGINSSKVANYDSHMANADIHITMAERTKLNGIEEGANKTVMDFGLSSTSSNPVANRIVTEEFSKKLDKNADITSATKCKVTYDNKGLVTAGADLTASDIPDLPSSKVTTMESYSKATSSASIATTDTLNVAIGKLEYKIDNPLESSLELAILTAKVVNLEANYVRVSTDALTITAPLMGATVTTSTVTVRGTCEASKTVSISVNSGTATSTTASTAGAFSKSVSLAVGINYITVTRGTTVQNLVVKRTT